MTGHSEVAPPLVSVVVATYNRSDVLRWALESLLDSTLADWEAWIVGDACTDDTEEVVDSLDDPRLRFVNLDTNHGEQSKPNNEGVRRARGRYLAFLNHDDLWLPHHLERCIDELESGARDLVYGLGVAWHHERPTRLSGATPDGRYRKTVNVAASAWVLRRELFDRIGPWKSFRECHSPPSQEWIQRAHGLGAAMSCVPEVTLLRFPSISRPDSYRESARYALEQQRCLERLRAEPRFVEEVLTRVARDYASEEAELPVWPLLRRSLLNVCYRTALTVGASPPALRNKIRFGRRGALIDKLRRIRGLPPAP